MAQVSSYALTPNQSGILTRQQIGAVLAAMQSLNSGATGPTNPVAGMLWLDTSTNPWIPRIRNDANTSWVLFLPADGAITNAKLAPVVTGIIKGRSSAGTGAVEDLTAAQALAILGITANAAQINPLANAFDNAFLGAGLTGNLATGANDFTATPWTNSVTSGGVTATRTAAGPDWVEYSVNGTGTGAATIGLYAQPLPATPATQGQAFTFGANISLVSGAITGSGGVRLDLNGLPATTGGASTQGGATAFVTTLMGGVTQAVMTAAGATAAVRMSCNLRVAAGVVYNNAVFRISGLQLDRGASRQTYRFRALSAAEARVAMGGVPTINETPPITISGTSSGEIVGLPFTMREITLHLDTVSLTTTSSILIQFGTASGWLATGYDTRSTQLATSGLNSLGSLNGVLIYGGMQPSPLAG